MRTSRLLVGLLVLGLAVTLVSPVDAQKRGGTLTIVRPTDPVSLDPNLETTAPGAWVYFNMLDGPGLQPRAGGHRAVQVRGVEDQRPRDHRAESRLLGRQAAGRPRGLQGGAGGRRPDDRAPDRRRGHGPLPLARPAAGAAARFEVHGARDDGHPRRVRRHARGTAAPRRRARAAGAAPRRR